VARMVAAKRRELGFPLRLYSIPNLFRYERPQRGRLREHWQLNVDVFGLAGIEAEAEIILLATEIMDAFGVSQDKYEVRVNSRNTINTFLENHLNNEEDRYRAIKLMDKAGKDEKASQELESLLKGKTVEADAEINELIAKLKALNVNNVRFDSNLVRGLDYYTGVVFEVFDLNPDNNRSLFGGGRYDRLLEVFGEDPIPTVGFGMGDVMFKEVLSTYNLLPEYVPASELTLIPLSASEFEACDKLAVDLR